MLFCSECGQKLNDNEKFCHSCGAKTKANSTRKNDWLVFVEASGSRTPKNESSKVTRETIYEGNIHKCPNCGETIKSFETVCPSCGHEFRNVTATSSVSELADKILKLESEK